MVSGPNSRDFLHVSTTPEAARVFNIAVHEPYLERFCELEGISTDPTHVDIIYDCSNTPLDFYENQDRDAEYGKFIVDIEVDSRFVLITNPRILIDLRNIDIASRMGVVLDNHAYRPGQAIFGRNVSTNLAHELMHCGRFFDRLRSVNDKTSLFKRVLDRSGYVNARAKNLKAPVSEEKDIKHRISRLFAEHKWLHELVTIDYIS